MIASAYVVRNALKFVNFTIKRFMKYFFKEEVKVDIKFIKEFPSHHIFEVKMASSNQNVMNENKTYFYHL